MDDAVDLGSGFSMRYFGWRPDRNIAENAARYANVPDIEKLGAIVTCSCGIEGAIHFDVPGARDAFPSSIFWTVESWDPLTISPSVQCHCPAMCHGYIRDGKWVGA